MIRHGVPGIGGRAGRVANVFIAVLLLAVPGGARASSDTGDCLARFKSGAPVSFSERSLKRGSLLFRTVFREQDWAGDLVAVCLDGAGGETVCDDPIDPSRPEVKWSAAAVADEIDARFGAASDDGWWHRRRVITWDSESSVARPFRYDALGNRQRNLLGNDPDLVRYLRGDRSLEGVRFRERGSHYGDFIHFPPAAYGSVVLAGANDGMLHVFAEATGAELFSYVPGLVFGAWHEESAAAGAWRPKLARLGDFDYEDKHDFFVDGGASIRYLGDRATTIAAVSLGRGGRGVFALNLFGVADLADAESAARQVALWEYPDPRRDRLQIVADAFVEIPAAADESADAYRDTVTALSTDPFLGEVHGAPQVVKLPHPELPGYKWAVVFGNGYRSWSQTPVLYILDAFDGSVLKRIVAARAEDAARAGSSGTCPGELGCNGLSTPVLVDYDEDGLTDYGYAGDLRGNLWKFDFTGGAIFGADGYVVAFADGADLDATGRPAPRPLIAVRDASGRPQPIVAKPTVTRPCTVSGDGLMVLFGTGHAEADAGSTAAQSVYGIWDWQQAWSTDPAPGIDPTAMYYGGVATVQDASLAGVCSDAARADCESACTARCEATADSCRQTCADTWGTGPGRQTCEAACDAGSGDCRDGCVDRCIAAAGAGFDAATCQAVCSAERDNCVAAAADDAAELACEHLLTTCGQACASFWDAYLGCSGSRTLSNMAAIAAADRAASITLLRQSEASFAGIDLYAADDPEVVAGAAEAGDVRDIDNEPADSAGYDALVRTVSANPIAWMSPAALAAPPAGERHVGWYFDLPLDGEQLASDPVVLDGVLYYATRTPSADSCGDGGVAVIMAHDSCSGGRSGEIVFDLDHDGMLNSGDAVALYDLGSPLPVSGIAVPETAAPPAFIAALDRDYMFIAEHLPGTDGFGGGGGAGDPLAGSVSGMTKRVVRGKNLGLSYWRELP